MLGFAVESRPLEVAVTLPCDEGVIGKAERELRRRALGDSDGCYGYFPSLEGVENIDSDLPACRQFAESVVGVDIAGMSLAFNFLRISLVEQKADSPFHLDSDAATALTGDTTTISERLVWRLLVNMSTTNNRRLSYLNADSFDLTLETDGGYTNCPDRLVTPDMVRRINIPPRVSNVASAVLFCASRVLHTGSDDENGHFVAAFGFEE